MTTSAPQSSVAGASHLLYRDHAKSVWLTCCASRGDPTVIKTPTGRTPEAIAEFDRLVVREVFLSSALPRSVAVRVIRYAPGLRPWIEMEWGGVRWDYAVKLADRNHRLKMLSGLAESLAVVHRAGIIHGDLKPANVYISEDSPRDRAGRTFRIRLADFAYGLRTDEPEQYRAGLGTVGYMAPETILNGHCSIRSDLFAFGVMAWETLSGRHPFILSPEDDPLHVCSRCIEATPPQMDDLREQELIDLLTILLARDPDLRRSSAEEVARVLRLAAASPGAASADRRRLLAFETSDLRLRTHQQQDIPVAQDRIRRRCSVD